MHVFDRALQGNSSVGQQGVGLLTGYELLLGCSQSRLVVVLLLRCRPGHRIFVPIVAVEHEEGRKREVMAQEQRFSSAFFYARHLEYE